MIRLMYYIQERLLHVYKYIILYYSIRAAPKFFVNDLDLVVLKLLQSENIRTVSSDVT